MNCSTKYVHYELTCNLSRDVNFIQIFSAHLQNYASQTLMWRYINNIYNEKKL